MAVTASFGIQDCKVAAYNDTNSYGTAYDVWAISQLQVTEQTVNAELNGDDSTVEVHSKSRVWQIQFQFGFKDRNIWPIITGAVLNTSYLTSATMLDFGVRNYPYFGLIAKVDETNGTGCSHIWIPKCKIMNGFPLNFQYGQFATPQVTIEAVADDTFHGFQVYEYTTLKTLVIPPT